MALSPVESIPEPQVIRRRLDDIRQEARLLKELLKTAEMRERIAQKPTRLSADRQVSEGRR
jgi:hypothetical protein